MLVKEAIKETREELRKYIPLGESIEELCTALQTGKLERIIPKL